MSPRPPQPLHGPWPSAASHRRQVEYASWFRRYRHRSARRTQRTQHHPGSRRWLTDSTSASILVGTRHRRCSAKVGALTLIRVVMKLEELMHIRLGTYRRTLRQTLFEVITDMPLSGFHPAVVDVMVVESSNEVIEFTARAVQQARAAAWHRCGLVLRATTPPNRRHRRPMTRPA